MGEIGHRFPMALPDGSTVLYTAVRFYDWSHARIMALNLDTGASTFLVEGGSDAHYAASGHLLFAREGRLMAVAFDPERLQVRGEPVPVLEGLVHSVNTGTRRRETGAVQYGLSRDGMLLFGPGSGYPEQGFGGQNARVAGDGTLPDRAGPALVPGAPCPRAGGMTELISSWR